MMRLAWMAAYQNFGIYQYFLREELHWLPMQKRIEFKILMFMRNCLAGQAPIYLMELCVPVLSIPGRRFLRSATHGDLVVPMARSSTVLHRSFAMVGPSFWNKLPISLRNELLLSFFAPFPQAFENHSLWLWFGVRLGAPLRSDLEETLYKFMWLINLLIDWLIDWCE